MWLAFLNSKSERLFRVGHYDSALNTRAKVYKWLTWRAAVRLGERMARDRLMPTVLRIGAYRLAFYSSNGSEPPHVHVISATGQAKFWLDPLSLARSVGASARELRRIESIVRDNREQLLRSWHEYFG